MSKEWMIGTLCVIVFALIGFIAYGWDSDIDSLQVQANEVHREVGKLQVQTNEIYREVGKFQGQMIGVHREVGKLLKGQELIIQYLLTGDKQALSNHFKELNHEAE